MKKWKKLSQQYLLKTKWLSLRKDGYETPEGKIIDDFYIVERPDFVIVVPIDIEGRFFLVRQYRHGVEKTILNFPMGFLDNGEEPIKGAIRELAEEVGFSSKNVERLGDFLLAPPFTKITAHVFLASGLKQREKKLHTKDPGEIEEVVMVSGKELEHLIKTKEVVDLPSICAYLLAKNRPY